VERVKSDATPVGVEDWTRKQMVDVDKHPAECLGCTFFKAIGSDGPSESDGNQNVESHMEKHSHEVLTSTRLRSTFLGEMGFLGLLSIEIWGKWWWRRTDTKQTEKPTLRRRILFKECSHTMQTTWVQYSVAHV